jgi:RNA polymerase sigma factor (sigma-70 family)
MDHLTDCTCDQCLLIHMRSTDAAERQLGWQAWYCRDAAAVDAFVRRRCSAFYCADHSEDILQDCFLIGFRKVSTGRYSEQSGPLCGYLFGIAKLLIMALVRGQRCAPADLNEEVEAKAVLSLDDALYGEEVVMRVHEACTRLSQLEQLVLEGIYLEGCSSDMLAEKLSRTAGNVRIIAHRAVGEVEKYLVRRHNLPISPAAIRACLEALSQTTTMGERVTD